MFDEKGQKGEEEEEGELVNFGICGLLFLGLVALIPLYTKSTALSNLKGIPLFTEKYIEIAEKKNETMCRSKYKRVFFLSFSLSLSLSLSNEKVFLSHLSLSLSLSLWTIKLI